MQDLLFKKISELRPKSHESLECNYPVEALATIYKSVETTVPGIYVASFFGIFKILM